MVKMLMALVVEDISGVPGVVILDIYGVASIRVTGAVSLGVPGKVAL